MSSFSWNSDSDPTDDSSPLKICIENELSTNYSYDNVILTYTSETNKNISTVGAWEFNDQTEKCAQFVVDPSTINFEFNEPYVLHSDGIIGSATFAMRREYLSRSQNNFYSVR